MWLAVNWHVHIYGMGSHPKKVRWTSQQRIVLSFGRCSRWVAGYEPTIVFCKIKVLDQPHWLVVNPLMTLLANAVSLDLRCNSACLEEQVCPMQMCKRNPGNYTFQFLWNLDEKMNYPAKTFSHVWRSRHGEVGNLTGHHGCGYYLLVNPDR